MSCAKYYIWIISCNPENNTLRCVLSLNSIYRWGNSFSSLSYLPRVTEFISKFKIQLRKFASNARILHPYTFQTSIAWPEAWYVTQSRASEIISGREQHMRTERRWLQRTVNSIVEAWSRSKENQRPYCEDFVFQVTQWKAICIFKRSPLMNSGKRQDKKSLSQVAPI